jgi:DNA transformation protein and related proteins
MPISDGFIELLKDALSGFGPMSVRRMFGGAGLYADGVMFGLVTDDILYLKADEATKGAFEAEGLGSFVYSARGRSVTMSYWRAPERLLDDPEEMMGWARTALGVAQRKAAAKPKGSAPGKGAPKNRRRC